MTLHTAFATVLSLSCLPADLGSETPWPKIIGVAQDGTTPLGARRAALRLACDRADQEGAAQIVAVATGWLQRIDQSGLAAEQIARDPVLSPTRELIHALACDDGAQLSAAGDASSLLTLWTLIATRPWTSRETKEAAFSLIATNASPVAARRDAGLSALRFSGVGQAGAVPAGLADLLDASCTWPLRTILRESRDPRSFNFTASAWLAGQGDATILPDLQRLYPAFERADPRFGRALAWYSWQIQVQNPPSGLLFHIASAELYTAESRRWALRRAVELNLPAEDIRQAILVYALGGRPFGPNRLAFGIGSLKALGLQLGVLAPADLPNVPARATDSAGTASRPFSWDLAAPAVDWNPPWEPRWENHEVFVTWLRTRPWQGLSAQDAARLLHDRACELGLHRPQACAP